MILFLSSSAAYRSSWTTCPHRRPRSKASQTACKAGAWRFQLTSAGGCETSSCLCRGKRKRYPKNKPHGQTHITRPMLLTKRWNFSQITKKNNPLRKLESEMASLGSSLEKVNLLLGQKSPTVSEAKHALKVCRVINVSFFLLLLTIIYIMGLKSVVVFMKSLVLVMTCWCKHNYCTLVFLLH